MHAAEQQRPDVQARRAAWIIQQLGWDSSRLVFIDESGARTNLVRQHGRCLRGRRLVAYAPHGHWKTTTLVVALREDGLTAPMVLDGAMNGKAFLAYVRQVLVPTLQPGDLVVMDNLSSHKSSGVVMRSSRSAHDCTTCRLTARTSTRSSWRSVSSNGCCARLPNEPSTPCGHASGSYSTRSHQRSVAITSATAATTCHSA
jgi:DDE superfamily endonuclease